MKWTFISPVQSEMTTNLHSLGRSVQSVRLRISIEGFLTVSFQMHRLDMPFMFDLLETDIPLRITYTGHVSFVDAAGNEFSILLSQNMGTLTIHVLMFENEAVPALIKSYLAAETCSWSKKLNLWYCWRETWCSCSVYIVRSLDFAVIVCRMTGMRVHVSQLL